MKNTDPFAPWNDPIHRDDRFAPHNNPRDRDNPSKPWNDPVGKMEDLEQNEGHDHLVEHGWSAVAWKAAGGYGNQSASNVNAKRERIWFSPACLSSAQQGLFP